MNGWAPIGRLAGIGQLWGGKGRWRKVAAGRTWALIWIRRDDTINPRRHGTPCRRVKETTDAQP